MKWHPVFPLPVLFSFVFICFFPICVLADPFSGELITAETHVFEMALTDARYDGSDINEFLDAHAVNDYRIGGPARTADGYCRLYLYNLSSDDAASCLLIHDIKISGDTWDLGPEIRGFLNQEERSERILCRDSGLWDEDSEIVIDFKPPGTVQGEGFLLIDVEQVQPYGDSITVPDFIRFNRTEQKLDNNQRVTITIPLFIESSPGSGQTPPDTPAQEETPIPTRNNEIEPAHSPLRKPIIEIAITDTKVDPGNKKLLRKHWIDLNNPLNPGKLTSKKRDTRSGKIWKTLYLYNVSTGNDTYFKITGISFEDNRYTVSNAWRAGVTEFQSDTGPLTIAFTRNLETDSDPETDSLNISFEVFKGDNRQFKVNGKQMPFQKAGKGVLAIKVDSGAGIGFMEIGVFFFTGIVVVLLIVVVLFLIYKIMKARRARFIKSLQKQRQSRGTSSFKPSQRVQVGMLSRDYDHLQRQINENRTKHTDSRESLERLEQVVHEKIDRSEQAKLITIDTIDQWIGRSPRIQELEGAADAQKNQLQHVLTDMEQSIDGRFSTLLDRVDALERRLDDAPEILKVMETVLHRAADAVETQFRNICRDIQTVTQESIDAMQRKSLTSAAVDRTFFEWLTEGLKPFREREPETVDKLVDTLNAWRCISGDEGIKDNVSYPPIPMLTGLDAGTPEERLAALIVFDFNALVRQYRTQCDDSIHQWKATFQRQMHQRVSRFVNSDDFMDICGFLYEYLENTPVREFYEELLHRLRVEEIGVHINQEVFNPQLHDAVEQAASYYPINTVIGRIRPGFIRDGRVVRRAQVRISRGRSGAEIS